MSDKFELNSANPTYTQPAAQPTSALRERLRKLTHAPGQEEAICDFVRTLIDEAVRSTLDEIATKLTTYPNQVSPICVEVIRNWRKPAVAARVPGNVLVEWFNGNPYVRADAYVRATGQAALAERDKRVAENRWQEAYQRWCKIPFPDGAPNSHLEHLAAGFKGGWEMAQAERDRRVPTEEKK